MLECRDEFYEDLAIRREGVRNGPANVFFVYQSRLRKPARVLGNCLFVGLEALDDPFERDAGMSSDDEENIDASVICDSLEVPLQLSRVLNFSGCHKLIITLQHSQECWSVARGFSTGMCTGYPQGCPRVLSQFFSFSPPGCWITRSNPRERAILYTRVGFRFGKR